jgi:hypothetical protein
MKQSKKIMELTAPAAAAAALDPQSADTSATTAGKITAPGRPKNAKVTIVESLSF